MTQRGLILDFGGVVTTDFYGALSAFCVREGLAPDAIRCALRDTPEGQQALAAVEAGEISQREYEITLGGCSASTTKACSAGCWQTCGPLSLCCRWSTGSGAKASP